MLAFLALGVHLGCEDATRPPPPAPEYPWAKQEAEHIALWLSGDLVAPETLSRTIQQELAWIRTRFGEQYPALRRVGFAPPSTAVIVVQFSSDVIEEILQGTYSDWDELNADYELVDIRTHRVDNYVSLTFQGIKHPGRLAAAYIQLRGANFAQPTGARMGDSPRLYPLQESGRRTYLFRDAWGDCPAGCGVSHYYYFTPEGGRFRFVGDWLSGDPPDWWGAAEKNVALYRSWFECCRFGEWVPTTP